VEHIHLDGQPEVVRQFVLSLSDHPDGAVLELSGRPVACLMPPPTTTNGTAAYPGDWTEAKNSRRCELIDRKYASALTPKEGAELAGLQEEMLRYRQRVAPLPLEGARRLHQDLLAIARQQDSGK
jgi:predicted nuclease with RNAse H fold